MTHIYFHQFLSTSKLVLNDRYKISLPKVSKPTLNLKTFSSSQNISSVSNSTRTSVGLLDNTILLVHSVILQQIVINITHQYLNEPRHLHVRKQKCNPSSS